MLSAKDIENEYNKYYEGQKEREGGFWFSHSAIGSLTCFEQALES